MRLLSTPITLQTASALVTAFDYAKIVVANVEITGKASALLDSLPALSLGQFVEDNQFTYVGEPGHIPYLRRHGHQHMCYPTYNVPSITAGRQGEKVGAKDDPGVERPSQASDPGAERPSDSSPQHQLRATPSK